MASDQALDPLAEHEAEWGAPRDQWTARQWREAAESLSAALADFDKLCVDWRESYQGLLDDYKHEMSMRMATEQLLRDASAPKRPGRPKKKIWNALHPLALKARLKTGRRGRPRKHTREDDEGLVFLIEHEMQERRARGRRRVTARAAARSLIQQWRKYRLGKGLPDVSAERAEKEARTWYKRYYEIKAAGYKAGVGGSMSIAPDLSLAPGSALQRYIAKRRLSG